MAQQTIDVGTAPNDGTGDPERTAWTKANDNFTELYARGGGNVTAPQGRLTLQTGTPVMTTTQSAKTTIYYTPYNGSTVPIYNGISFTNTAFTELSVATTDTTKSPAAIGVSKVNDWFVWSDSGTLRLGHGPDWTSDTVRSAGTALVMVNGIWLNNASITNGPAASRGTYVGTTRSNAASSQLDWIYGAASAGGTPGFFGVWNAYNRTLVGTMVQDTSASWAYSVAAWRQANGLTNMQVSIVSGLQNDFFISQYATAGISSVANSGIGIGYDNTTSPSGSTGIVGVSIVVQSTSFFEEQPFGFHVISALEFGSGAGTTFYGIGTGTQFRNGLHLQFLM